MCAVLFLGRDGKASASPRSVQPMLWVHPKTRQPLCVPAGVYDRMQKGTCDSFYTKHLASVSLFILTEFSLQL